VDARLPVRALVRDPAKAEAFGIPGTVEVAEGDMLKPTTLDGALDGVERALMISGPDGHMLETQCTFVDAAKRAGVRDIIKLSGMGCWDDATFRFARMHAEVERYLEGPGVAWTHLRPSTFMQTFLLEVPTILHDGTMNLPMADAKLSPVDVDDIAQVAVALPGSVPRRHVAQRSVSTSYQPASAAFAAAVVCGVAVSRQSGSPGSPTSNHTSP
jgi:uncharacterized protein YbjT (DUF2867 family)